MALDASDQIEKFQEFFNLSYKKNIHTNISKGWNFLIVDFFKLAEFDPRLADELLEEPDETVKAAEIAMEQFDIKAKFRVRFDNLPSSQRVNIRDTRSRHLGKFISYDGIIRQSSEVRPQAVSAKFECPSCGNTITMPQVDQQFREPTRCTCGRKGKFRLLSKELVDVQRLVIEESPETLEGGAQPKRLSVFLREDLVEPRMERRTTPGTRVITNGVVVEVPIITRTGGISTRFDLVMNANFVAAVEEDFSEINLNREDEEMIKELSKDPRIYEKLVESISPSIFGHEKVKEAILLQLFGGVRKIKREGTKVRGDMHILLVGDPGCLVADSQVSLYDGGMEKIGDFGFKHKQKINVPLTTINGCANGKVFHKYKQKLVLKVVTESGKQVICTLDHPLMGKDGWKRADCFVEGEKIRVMPLISNEVKDYVSTAFKYVKKSTGKLKDVSLPDKFDENLAALCGYVLGDGNVHPRGYTVTCYVSDEEKELLPKLKLLWKKVFDVVPAYVLRKPKQSFIIDKTGSKRKIESKQFMHLFEVNSKHVAQALSFLSVKRVPQVIFKSPKKVVASFLRWLFEADGCAFGNGRGRTSIQLKSTRNGLLRDVQLLLLYFGIHSRIVGDNLCIRRAHDMELFIQNIGFVSQKKKKCLKNVEKVIEQRARRWKGNQEWEKINSIELEGVKDVYDFEVPGENMFVANGIVVHNCGKSQLLTFVDLVAPKSRYVAGRSASGAGLTASVVKDEFLRGWALEAGAMVLADKGTLVLDEMDKISRDDTAALHEAMEQQQISIAKANIQATLRTQTSVLAAANPKFGRFDPFIPIPQQIDLPPALITRFDLIFPMRDLPDKDKDASIADKILGSHSYKDTDPEISKEVFRKYLAYTKQKIFPKLTEEAIVVIKEFYVNLRSSGQQGDQPVKAIPISARQIEAAIRLSEACAKIRLSDKVSKMDAVRAVSLLKGRLTELGMDPESGTIDIDRMTSGTTASTRNAIITVREVIFGLCEEKDGAVSIEDDVKPKVFAKGVTEAKLEEAVNKLKKSGDLFEPKRGWLQKI